MTAVRRIIIPYRRGWPVVVELRESGGARALFADGTARLFVLEADLLAAYGWTPAQLQAWAEQPVPEGYRDEAETAWVVADGAEGPVLAERARAGWKVIKRLATGWLLRRRR